MLPNLSLLRVDRTDADDAPAPDGLGDVPDDPLPPLPEGLLDEVLSKSRRLSERRDRNEQTVSEGGKGPSKEERERAAQRAELQSVLKTLKPVSKNPDEAKKAALADGAAMLGTDSGRSTSEEDDDGGFADDEAGDDFPDIDADSDDDELDGYRPYSPSEFPDLTLDDDEFESEPITLLKIKENLEKTIAGIESLRVNIETGTSDYNDLDRESAAEVIEVIERVKERLKVNVLILNNFLASFDDEGVEVVLAPKVDGGSPPGKFAPIREPVDEGDQAGDGDEAAAETSPVVTVDVVEPEVAGDRRRLVVADPRGRGIINTLRRQFGEVLTRRNVALFAFVMLPLLNQVLNQLMIQFYAYLQQQQPNAAQFDPPIFEPPNFGACASRLSATGAMLLPANWRRRRGRATRRRLRASAAAMRAISRMRLALRARA